MMNKEIVFHENTPNVILCEGIDAYYFLIWFLDSKKRTDPRFEKFHVYNYGGITELYTYLKSFVKLPKFKKFVQSITIIRDAEQDPHAASQSINNALTQIGFQAPDKPFQKITTNDGQFINKSTGFLLFPTCSSDISTGTLEDLCVKIMKDVLCLERLPDVQNLLDKYSDLPRIHKNILHTCFSVTDKFVSLKIGEAAKAEAFDWSSSQIQFLEKFLLKMANLE